MKVDIVMRWLLFQPKRLILKIRHGHRFLCGSKCKVSQFASIHLDSSKAKMALGDRVSIRSNAEIFAFGEGTLIVGAGTFINRNTIIGVFDKISIGRSVTIGPNVCIYDHNHGLHGNIDFEADEIIIGDNVWIGANVCILKGCKIGNNSVIGAGSVVTTDVPANSILIQKKENTFLEK